MASETTPLSGIFSKEHASQGLEYAKEKAQELRKQVSEGDLSIKVFAFLGGLALVITSAFEFLGKIFTLNVVGAVMDVYTFLLGVLILILEGGSKFPLTSRFLVKVHKYALFLKYVWGRGILYFVTGTLQLSQWQLQDMIVGGFMSFVGVVYIIVGKQTSGKLQHLRQQAISPQTLREKFDQADSTNTGTLNIDEFQVLTKSLGLDLNRRENESAFMILDKDEQHGELSFKEFETWWNDQDEEAGTFLFV